MDELEQTLREILTPQKVAAYLDVREAFRAAEERGVLCGRVMLDLGTITRENLVHGEHPCHTCCFENIYMRHCFLFCSLGEILHFSDDVFRNLHPQTATSLKNLCQRTNDL